MGNKLEQLKRGHSRERLAPSNSGDQSLSNSTCSLNASPFNIVTRKPSNSSESTLNVEQLTTQTVNRRSKTSRRPPAANGGGFIQQRRSSTGTSLSSKFLFRSSSTSQLSSYYRCDDPSEDLNASDIAARGGNKSQPVQIPASACSTPSSTRAYNMNAAGYLPTKTVSCENIPIAAASLQAALQKAKAAAAVASDCSNQDVFSSGAGCGCPTNGSVPAGRFPYAFLRSRLTSLPEENQQSGLRSCETLPGHPAPVSSVPYDVNQIKAKMHQMYAADSERKASGGGGGMGKTRSSSTSCVFRETLAAPAYQHPPSHYGSTLLPPVTHRQQSDADADSGIEKEASSDSSSLYGSDVSSGGGNSWELGGRSSGDRSPPSPAEASRNPLVPSYPPKSELQYNHGPDSLPSTAPAATALAMASLSTHHRLPEASSNNHSSGNATTGSTNNNNNKWDYREVKHRMRSRASSLDSVKLGESRKWSPAQQSQRKSTSESVEAKSQNQQQQPTPTPPTKGAEKKLTSFLRGHVRSVSFGRGALTLPGRKSSSKSGKTESPAVVPPDTSSSAAAAASPPSVHFQIGHSTRYIPARVQDDYVPDESSRSPASLPPIQPPLTKQYRLLRLIKDESGELGILITLKRGCDGSMQGYVIGHVEPGGVADRYSSLNYIYTLLFPQLLSCLSFSLSLLLFASRPAGPLVVVCAPSTKRNDRRHANADGSSSPERKNALMTMEGMRRAVSGGGDAVTLIRHHIGCHQTSLFFF